MENGVTVNFILEHQRRIILVCLDVQGAAKLNPKDFSVKLKHIPNVAIDILGVLIAKKPITGRIQKNGKNNTEQNDLPAKRLLNIKQSARSGEIEPNIMKKTNNTGKTGIKIINQLFVPKWTSGERQTLINGMVTAGNVELC